MLPTTPARATHDQGLHGTVDLLTAREIANGKVSNEMRPPRTSLHPRVRARVSLASWQANRNGVEDDLLEPHTHVLVRPRMSWRASWTKFDHPGKSPGPVCRWRSAPELGRVSLFA